MATEYTQKLLALLPTVCRSSTKSFQNISDTWHAKWRTTITDVSNVFVRQLPSVKSRSALSNSLLTVSCRSLVYMLLIVPVIKSRRMRWAGHVARMGGGACTEFLWGSLREGGRWGDPGVDGRIILRWISRKWYARYGLDWPGSG